MVKKLLVVDDDRRIREILKQSFLWLGYKVITAENGEEGERLAREERPDLVYTVAWKVSAAVRALSSTAVLGHDEDDSFLLLIHPEEAEVMEAELLQAAAACLVPRLDASQPGDLVDAPPLPAHSEASSLRLCWSLET